MLSVEKGLKTMWKSCSKTMEKFCAKVQIAKIPVYKLFIPQSFSTIIPNFFPKFFSLSLPNIIHNSTVSTTITTNK